MFVQAICTHEPMSFMCYSVPEQALDLHRFSGLTFSPHGTEQQPAAARSCNMYIFYYKGYFLKKHTLTLNCCLNVYQVSVMTRCKN